MRVYLDNSVLNRPFDDQSQPRIWLETLCFVLILQMVETGELTVIRSAVHLLENARNTLAARRLWVDQCLKIAKVTARITASTRRRAGLLRLHQLDALHAAAAEQAGADYFITCDESLIRRYKGPMRTLTPVDFTLKLMKEIQ